MRPICNINRVCQALADSSAPVAMLSLQIDWLCGTGQRSPRSGETVFFYFPLRLYTKLPLAHCFFFFLNSTPPSFFVRFTEYWYCTTTPRA